MQNHRPYVRFTYLKVTGKPDQIEWSVGLIEFMTMNNYETVLRNLVLAPYIVKATALIGVKRKSGSNMFRHQISTLGILLDYKLMDPVLLKAAIIHDLFEDGAHLPGVNEDAIRNLDSDGPAVYALVREVSIRLINGEKEPKGEFLLRIMKTGSDRAKLLKLADRISNLFALGFVHDTSFVRKYVGETRDFILPYAKAINEDMFIELSDLVSSREKILHSFDNPTNVVPVKTFIHFVKDLFTIKR